MRAWRKLGIVAVILTGNAGCGGSTTTADPQDAGRDDAGRLASDAGDAASTADAGEASVDASVDLGDAGTGLACAQYCAAIMAACTGANAQYKDSASCLTACRYLPLGTSADDTGDSVGCRLRQAALAASQPNPHCWNAGPFGYGACGQPSEGFCDIAASLCSPQEGFDGGPPPYNSTGDCILRAAGYAMVDIPTTRVPPGPVGLPDGYSANGPASGDTLDCREYHLGNALQGGAARQLHCNHVGPVSSTCR